jgi:hypothetical protein
MAASVVWWLALQTTNTEVPGSIPGHSLGFFWGSWVWNGVHSASWSNKLSSYLNKEVTVRFGKLKMQLWDSMCWPHVNPVPFGVVGKDCQRRLLSRPKVRQSCSATDLILIWFWICYETSYSMRKHRMPTIQVKIPMRIQKEEIR